jgi:hypothetical protein
VTEADFAAVPERDGVRVVNVTPAGPGPGQAGWRHTRVSSQAHDLDDLHHLMKDGRTHD